MLANIIVLCGLCVVVSSDYVTRNNAFRTVENIQANGYPAETHHVTTQDGYILEMHRIPYGRDNGTVSEDKPIVFLMHGLMGASNGFIALGADYSLAYNLADANFDVWMGNARGNMYSRNHVSLLPDDETLKYSFFDFTFEEIGLHDLPEMIDYILEYTKLAKLHYIGHSQGGTVFLVFLSLRPEYNTKVESAHLFAAVGYQEYFPNEQIAASAVMVDYIYSLSLSMGIVELYPDFLDNLTPSNNSYRISDYCTGDLKQIYMCELFGIRHLVRDDSEIFPAGASLKQAAHYGQNIRDKLFRRYHHGTTNNLNIYGMEEPPLYNISIITTNVTMHYTVNDDLLDERDVLAMAADMPNTVVRKVARENFTHNDFIIALDAKELVTDYVIEAIRNMPSNTVGTTTENYDIIVVDHTTEAVIDESMDENDDNLEETDPVAVLDPKDSATSVAINMYLIMLSIYLLHK